MVGPIKKIMWEDKLVVPTIDYITDNLGKP